jgi:hypothetical protein
LLDGDDGLAGHSDVLRQLCLRHLNPYLNGETIRVDSGIRLPAK